MNLRSFLFSSTICLFICKRVRARCDFLSASSSALNDFLEFSAYLSLYNCFFNNYCSFCRLRTSYNFSLLLAEERLDLLDCADLFERREMELGLICKSLSVFLELLLLTESLYCLRDSISCLR